MLLCYIIKNKEQRQGHRINKDIYIWTVFLQVISVLLCIMVKVRSANFKARGADQVIISLYIKRAYLEG